MRTTTREAAGTEPEVTTVLGDAPAAPVGSVPAGARVLVVEDNEELAFGLRNSLEIAGYTVRVAGDGVAGLAALREHGADLVLLDLMLPELDGYRVLRAMRTEGITTPVLILTARNEEADKVTGFRLGADDYVTKPFGLLELLARVEALLRRAAQRAAPAPSRVVRVGALAIDFAARTVTRHGEPVALAPREFDLLEALVTRAPAVVARRELLRAVWGYDASVASRTVDTHVAELRRKLEDEPAAPRHIQTVWKVGYRFVA
jgi:two-component system, OmpR family, alkaline phosphatase synthesis response regulator PhoP